MKTERAFKIGSKVKWKSQAQGSWIEKRGKIIAIVPAGQRVYNVLQSDICASLDALTAKYSLQAIDSRTGSRGVTSYVIEVAPKGKGKPKLYWPMPSALLPA